MERMYRALARLSEVTLVAGFINLAMLILSVGQGFVYGGRADGPGFLSALLLYDVVLCFRIAVSILMDGVAILAIVVAWADSRRKWLLVLVAAAALPVITPAVILVGPALIRHNPFLVVSAVSLLPVALALAFARLRGGGRATLRAEADATLEITRSRL
ncbi:MAG TPA: hypothetical protein VFQ25_05805 [Ktedonobacterales bacterium]|nr:hypothetical protein [Ktedonobacterales bacterium]